MQAPSPLALAVMAIVVGGLVAAHLVATRGTGRLEDPRKESLSVSAGTTLSEWPHHLWAGFFHHSWGHLTFNLAVFAVSFPFAVRAMGPLQTMANAFWIGPFVVLTLHLLLVLPLAKAGVGYAEAAVPFRLVGFSVMAYSMAGAALVEAPLPWFLAAFGLLAVAEIVLAVFVTGPFVFAYHLAGFGLGGWVRILLTR